MTFSSDLFDNTQVAFAAKSNLQLHKARILFSLIANNQLVNLGSRLTGYALRFGLPISPAFRYTVYDHFCGGETFDECRLSIEKLKKYGVFSMLNYGVELKETETDFDKTIARNLEAIAFAEKNRDVKVVCIKLTGFGRFGLFEKLQAGEKLTADEKREYDRVVARFHRLCKDAQQKDVQLYVDAEESWIQDVMDELVSEMMAIYNTNEAIVFNTFQLYRHDRLAYLQQCLNAAKRQKFVLGAKLVRGAYMEKERARAAELSYPSPIHADKAKVDRDFNQALNLCLDNLEYVSVCVASQSEESNLLAVNKMEAKKIDRQHPHVLFSQLYGMGDNITFNLAKHGFNACKYLPYGPVKDVIPYLIRRAQENTSVAGQTGRELGLILEEIKRRRRC